ncbi:FAD:protein FMN transferase [bacterium SCSIO 12741]|nr:FAD:protein FMN transferase [bacterium SCSIO 12741]
MKNWAIILLGAITLQSCQPKEENNSWTIRGEAQGTTYQITGWEKSEVQKEEIDSLLLALDQSLSTWVKGSIIDDFNSGEEGAQVDQHFATNLWASHEVFQRTDGAFNPLIKPLLSYWGFGPDARKPEEVDSAKVDSLMMLMDWNQLWVMHQGDSLPFTGIKRFESLKLPINLQKGNPAIQLDFNAIAQGYSVDVIADYLDVAGLNHYLVELGGEMIVKGHKEGGKDWVVGIDKPVEGNQPGNRKLMATIALKDKAIATSGNYRKSVEIDGVKYHHTFDPHTGFPARHQLLSATVISESCQLADAYATAFMVMGYPKAKALLGQDEWHLEAMLVYSDSTGEMKTYLTQGLENQIKYLEE